MSENFKEAIKPIVISESLSGVTNKDLLVRYPKMMEKVCEIGKEYNLTKDDVFKCVNEIIKEVNQNYK